MFLHWGLFSKNKIIIMNKPFNVGLVRQITDYYDDGKISYGRMVEILNEIAIEWHEKIINEKYERITNSKEN